MRRLYAMGIITTKKSLVQLEKLSTSALCRRRLSVVMVRLKMAETLKEACTLIEQVGQCALSLAGEAGFAGECARRDFLPPIADSTSSHSVPPSCAQLPAGWDGLASSHMQAETSIPRQLDVAKPFHRAEEKKVADLSLHCRDMSGWVRRRSWSQHIW